MMFLNSDSDPILWWSFLTFLDGATLLWFSNLPVGSITSFDEFAKMFINHFAVTKIYVRDSDYLSTIKQRQHESLKDYMTRFTTVTMEIPDLNPEVQLHAIKSGLRSGKFQEAITVAKSMTLEEFRDKATGWIEIEELCGYGYVIKIKITGWGQSLTLRPHGGRQCSCLGLKSRYSSAAAIEMVARLFVIKIVPPVRASSKQWGVPGKKTSMLKLVYAHE